eukprot:2911851-Prymnesium_polylepis.1
MGPAAFVGSNPDASPHFSDSARGATGTVEGAKGCHMVASTVHGMTDDTGCLFYQASLRAATDDGIER